MNRALEKLSRMILGSRKNERHLLNRVSKRSVRSGKSKTRVEEESEMGQIRNPSMEGEEGILVVKGVKLLRNKGWRRNVRRTERWARKREKLQDISHLRHQTPRTY